MFAACQSTDVEPRLVCCWVQKYASPIKPLNIENGQKQTRIYMSDWLCKLYRVLKLSCCIVTVQACRAKV